MPKRKHILEILGVYALISLLGWQFNDQNWTFVGAAFHPYLAVIAVLGSTRGSTQTSTLTASLIASLLFLVGSLREENLVLPLGSIGLVVLSFLATGVILGLAQRVGSRKLKTLRFHLNQSFSTRDQLRRNLKVLEHANELLNNKVQGQLTTPYSFSEIARGLSNLDEQDLYQAMCDAVCQYIHVQEASFYLLSDGGHLVQMARTGPVRPSQGLFGATESENNVLAELALSRRAAVTAMDLDLFGVNKQHVGHHLICAPLLDPRSGTPMGVLCIDRISFARFSNVSKGSLVSLANFAAGAISNARERESLRNESEPG